MSNVNGDWDSCKMYVLEELRRMNDLHEKMDTKLDGIQAQLHQVQIKVAGIAVIAGILVTIITNFAIKAISG